MQTNQHIIEDWVKTPISCTLGSIWLSGFLRTKSQIPSDKMRILGKYAIVLITSGEVFYSDENGNHTNLREGGVIMVTPELAHAYGSANGHFWSQSYAVFDGPQFDLLQQSNSICLKQPCWEVESAHMWKDRLKAIMHPNIHQNPSRAIQTIGRFTQLLIDLATWNEIKTPAEDNWLNKSMRLLSEPVSSVWLSPQAVAKEVGLNYENFRKLFNQHTGFSPGKFQRNRKIDQACAMIYRGHSNLKELSEELGFCDPYHFSKVFRQIKGIPPSDYRRSVRGN